MESMYLGRIVAIAVAPSGRPAALYRVSSRSFPNRKAVIGAAGDVVAIVPRTGFEPDMRENPYIAYNCLRLTRDAAVLGNGSHTDPIAEKIAAGMPVRDALALSLLALDYEKDDYNTPRIAAVVDAGQCVGWLAVVRRDGLDVRSFRLERGTVLHLSTYIHDVPGSDRISSFTPETAEDACEFAVSGGVFKHFLNPVTVVAAVAEDGRFRLAAKDVSVRTPSVVARRDA